MTGTESTTRSIRNANTRRVSTPRNSSGCGVGIEGMGLHPAVAAPGAASTYAARRRRQHCSRRRYCPNRYNDMASPPDRAFSPPTWEGSVALPRSRDRDKRQYSVVYAANSPVRLVSGRERGEHYRSGQATGGHMAKAMELHCRCGEVVGRVENAAPQKVNRVVCYCDDCQAFAHQLGRADLLKRKAAPTSSRSRPRRSPS